MRAALLVLVTLATSQAVAAAQEAGGHAGIPWWEIFKQAVNFSILVGVLVYFLRKPVSAYLQERTQMLRASIADAASARASAAEKLLSIVSVSSRILRVCPASSPMASSARAYLLARLPPITARSP